MYIHSSSAIDSPFHSHLLIYFYLLVIIWGQIGYVSEPLNITHRHTHTFHSLDIFRISFFLTVFSLPCTEAFYFEMSHNTRSQLQTILGVVIERFRSLIGRATIREVACSSVAWEANFSPLWPVQQNFRALAVGGSSQRTFPSRRNELYFFVKLNTR